MNSGKTFLFIAKPSILRHLLQTDPYQMVLYNGNVLIGSTSRLWKREFSEMIKFFDLVGIVKSTTEEGAYELHNDKGKLTAKLEVYLRMSCFGENLQTMFQIKKKGQDYEYIFRQRNASKTFKVQRHVDEHYQPLVAPLYNAVTDAKNWSNSQINLKENISLTPLFIREPTINTEHDCGILDEAILLNFQDDFDKISICYRPSENKFFDLLDMIGANVKTTGKQTEVTIQCKKLVRVDSFLKSIGGDLKASRHLFFEKDEDVVEMTADRIEKKLCGNKDCPAVKKFGEYGIGPLATGKNLGTVYGEIEPPITYGMSHTYGTMCEYGPYGVFSKPKHEELPFVPRNEEGTELNPVKPCKLKPCSPLKKLKVKSEKFKDPTWHSKGCPLYPERLRGGANKKEYQLNEENENLVLPKSPMIECKSVMDQFDNILAEYKKALGPCGHATCPYAQTLAEDTCKKMCEQQLISTKESSTISCTGPPCNMDGCPYVESPKQKRYPAGCGNPKCAYTKYKLGLVDADAELELQFLPPALGGNCGDPHCKYPLAPPLPPIHWDCPDPLPKGACKNLNCPFLPPRLKKFKTKGIKTGPCGSPMCPYALPQPCGAPTCPFITRPCPMAEDRTITSQKKQRGSLEAEEVLCENLDCPFAQEIREKELELEVDMTIEGEFQDCINPKCPAKRSKKKKMVKSCSNPDCPLNKLKPDDRNCGDKKKINKKTKRNSESVRKFEQQKHGCQKSSTSLEVSVCSDLDCPFANSRKKTENIPSTDSDSTASCHKKKDESMCSNLECPEIKSRAKKKKNCDQPDCPYAQDLPDSPSQCDDPNCPYLKPLPSCGIPNCPYEPISLSYICKNPNCPSRNLDFNTKIREDKWLSENQKPDNGSQQIDKVAIVVKTTTDCNDSPCDEFNNCDNMDCDVKDDSPTIGTEENNTKMTVPQKKKRKRKKKGKFVYSIGDSYPGTKLGHKECVTPIFNVPPHMGWLWNIHTPILNLKPRRGWRPGALTKTIASRIRAHRQSKGMGLLRLPIFKKSDGEIEEHDPKVIPRPTLQIQKKEGTYWVTMNPLKDPYSLVENEDPYMNCTPMTFKITSNKNKIQNDYCYCDGEEALEGDKSSSSSESELDIEFTPPAGVIHPERFKKRPNVVCCQAQYDPQDFQVPKKGKDKKGKDKKEKGKKRKGKKEKGKKKKK
ncbi:hypothetical protein ABEB36_003392 [Hypothenemus hampei]